MIEDMCQPLVRQATYAAVIICQGLHRNLSWRRITSVFIVATSPLLGDECGNLTKMTCLNGSQHDQDFDVFCADLVPPHRGVLVFLQFRADAVEFVCDCRVCLRDVIFEGSGPAIKNQGRDDQNFSQ